MYCVNCGNKVKDTDIYCSKCGKKINRETTQDKTSKQSNSEVLSMLWYNFFTYGRLPLGIIFNIIALFFYNYSAFAYDKIALGIFFINLAMIIFCCLTFYMLHTKNENSMLFIIFNWLLNVFLFL